MNGQRESWQTDVGAMIAGLITPAIGYLVTQNSFVYPATDPRGQPWFHQLILIGSVLLGAFVFLFGLVRFLQWVWERRR